MNTPKTVLVISASREQFEPTATLLRNDGYSVRFEKEAGRVLSYRGHTTPNLIISELAAPDIDGLQVCRGVRENHAPGAESAPVLLVGDLSITSTIVGDGFRCGAANYLQRPIDPLRLADICRDILQPAADPATDSRKKPAGDTASFPATDNRLRNIGLHTALFDHSRQGVALFSRLGKLEEMNPVLRGMLDYSEVELGRMSLYDFFFPHDLETGNVALEQIIQGTRDFLKVENGYLTAAGERKWGTLSVIAIRDAFDGSRLLLGVFDDPTVQAPVRAQPKTQSLQMRGAHSTLLDLTQWKIDHGLIGTN